MLKKLSILIMVFALLMTGCSSGKLNLTDNQKFNNQPEIFKFYNIYNKDGSNREYQDVYVKFEGNDLEQIVTSIPRDNLIWSIKDTQTILFQDEQNNIVSYDNKYERKIIAENANDKPDKVDFVAPKKGNKIVYVKGNQDSFYLKDGNSEKKIGDNVSIYWFDDDLKNILYVTNDNIAYLYNDGEIKMLRNNIYLICQLLEPNDTNGKINGFILFDNNCGYIIDLNGNEKEIINAQGVNLKSLFAAEDNTLMFTDKYNTLWAYDGVSAIKVGENVKNDSYDKIGDTFYYIQNTADLYEQNKNEPLINKTKISSDVTKITTTNQNKLIFSHVSGDIYSYQKDQDTVKIGQNMKDGTYLQKDYKGNVVYLTEDNELFLGDKILAQNIIGYGAKDNHVSYLTVDGDLYLYDTDSLEETMILQNANDFSQIYMTNTKIYPYRSDNDEDTYNIKQIYD